MVADVECECECGTDSALLSSQGKISLRGELCGPGEGKMKVIKKNEEIRLFFFFFLCGAYVWVEGSEGRNEGRR